MGRPLTINLQYSGDETWDLWCPAMQCCYPVKEDQLASEVEKLRLEYKDVLESPSVSVQSIIQNIPEPNPGQALPAVRIVKSPYGGVMPGQIGGIVSEIPGEGYAVYLEETYTKPFGGDSAQRRTTKFFTPDQIQIL